MYEVNREDKTKAKPRDIIIYYYAKKGNKNTHEHTPHIRCLHEAIVAAIGRVTDCSEDRTV